MPVTFRETRVGDYLRPHEQPRSMYPGEYVRHVERNLAPNWYARFNASRWGERLARELDLYTPLGSLFVFNPHLMRDWHSVFPVPLYEHSYFTFYREVTRDEGGREEIIGFHGAEGWRKTLTMLVQFAILKPSHKLSYLLAYDTFQEFGTKSLEDLDGIQLVR